MVSLYTPTPMMNLLENQHAACDFPACATLHVRILRVKTFESFYFACSGISINYLK